MGIFCNVDWEQLVLAGVHFPENKDLQVWVRNMKNKHGDDWTAWPQVGCKSHFVPWKKGFSSVVEIKLSGDTWEAFSADRSPIILDDEIKKQQAQFYKAGEKLTAEDLYDSTPVTFPMTHLFGEFPAIAKYPIDQWEPEGHLALDRKGWCRLIAKIASKDMLNLGLIFDKAKTVEAEVDKRDACKEKLLKSSEGMSSASS